MTPQRVTLITLGVADLAAAKAFYARLGWVSHSGTEGVAFFQMHGCVLGLFGLTDLATDQGRPGAALGTGPSRWPRISPPRPRSMPPSPQPSPPGARR